MSETTAREHRRGQHEVSGGQAALGAAMERQREKYENPEFLDRLRDADLDTADYPDIESLLGPETSGAHFVGNRKPGYERQEKWLQRNRAERTIAEAEPGRLCTERRRQLAWRSATRRDRQPRAPNTPDERRVIRSAGFAVANLRTNAIGGAGRDSVTEATAVTRTEETAEERTVKDKAGEFLR